MSKGEGKKKSLPPPLRWPGTKPWLAPALDRHWAPHRARRLVEPFCGGLGFTLELKPRKALLNDVNPYLIYFYRWVRTGLVLPPYIALKNSPRAWAENVEAYETLVHSRRAESKDAAALFYYLNRGSLGGGVAFNDRGEFVIPSGKGRKVLFTRDFMAFKKVFRGVDLMIGDFAAMKLAPDDFVLADPPHPSDDPSGMMPAFGEAEHHRLLDWLAAHRGPQLVVLPATDAMAQLYGDAGFRLERVRAPKPPPAHHGGGPAGGGPGGAQAGGAPAIADESDFARYDVLLASLHMDAIPERSPEAEPAHDGDSDNEIESESENGADRGDDAAPGDGFRSDGADEHGPGAAPGGG